MDSAALIDELFDTIERLNDINARLWHTLALYLSAEEYEELMKLYNKEGDVS